MFNTRRHADECQNYALWPFWITKNALKSLKVYILGWDNPQHGYIMIKVLLCVLLLCNTTFEGDKSCMRHVFVLKIAVFYTPTPTIRLFLASVYLTVIDCLNGS